MNIFLVLKFGEAMVGFDLWARVFENEDDAWSYLAGPTLTREQFQALSAIKSELVSFAGYEPEDWDLDALDPIPDCLMEFTNGFDNDELCEMLDELEDGTVFTMTSGSAKMVIGQGSFM